MSEISVLTPDRRRARYLTEQAATWYLDLRDEADATMQEAFLTWLRTSPAHVAEYLAIARLHGDMKAAASIESLDTGQLIELAASERSVVPLRRDKAIPRQEPVRRPRPRRARKIWAACASLFAVAVLAGAGWWEFADTPAQTYIAEADSTRTVNLPDGSMIELDRGSAIAVRFDERQRRIELLHGAAIVDVGKDPHRPLLVTVGDHVLQDVGTVFDVHRDGQATDITVIHGRVMVWDQPHTLLSRINRRLTGTAITGNVVADLGSGQRVRVGEHGGGTVTMADLAQTTDWLPGTLSFQHSTVAEVARRFNTYTPLPLVIEDERVAATRISGVFHARDADAFIAYLATLPSVTVLRESDRVRIVARATDARKRL
jgi:transmembrane sensor